MVEKGLGWPCPVSAALKNPIYPLLSSVLALGQSLRHFLDKVTWWHFQSTSKEVIWPKKILNYMQGLKSAILAIFQKGLGWPCPVKSQLNSERIYEVIVCPKIPTKNFR